jgi:hypothetical protein
MNGDWNPENRVFLCITVTLRKLLGVAHNELDNMPYIDRKLWMSTFHRILRFGKIYFSENNIQI